MNMTTNRTWVRFLPWSDLHRRVYCLAAKELPCSTNPTVCEADPEQPDATNPCVCAQASSRILDLSRPLAISALRIPLVAWAARRSWGLFDSSREWWNGIQRREVLQENCLMTNGYMKTLPKIRTVARKGRRLWWAQYNCWCRDVRALRIAGTAWPSRQYRRRI